MSEAAETPFRKDPEGALLKPSSPWRTAPADGALLLALLAAGNWFLSPADPGWERLNPTPWLILPVFLGGRYGVAAGVTGAMAAAASILFLHWASANEVPADAIGGHPYLFLSLLLGAALGTLLFRLSGSQVEPLKARARELLEGQARLSEDTALLRTNEAHLVESLLLHGAENVSLTAGLQRLFTGERGRFEEGLLGLLEREFGIVSAAIYRDDTGLHGRLARMAATPSGEADLPPQIPSPEAPLAAAALEQGRIATWREAVSTPESGQRSHLAALPWAWSPVPGGGPRALLLIGRMHFPRITWENLARIEAVFSWCMARHLPGMAMEEGAGAERILTPALFLSRIREARILEEATLLPARLVLFQADPGAEPEVLAEFVTQLKRLAPPADLLGAVGDGRTAPYSIGWLTPAPSPGAAEAMARALLGRIGPASRAVRFEVLPVAALADPAGHPDPGRGAPSPAPSPTPPGPATS